MQSMLKRKPQVRVCVWWGERIGRGSKGKETRRLVALPRASPTLPHPLQIKTTPIDLTSTTPPPLKTAALAAENAMRHGTPRRTALAAAAEEAAVAAPASSGGVMEAFQRAEEEALLAELARVRSKGGER